MHENDVEAPVEPAQPEPGQPEPAQPVPEPEPGQPAEPDGDEQGDDSEDVGKPEE